MVTCRRARARDVLWLSAVALRMLAPDFGRTRERNLVHVRMIDQRRASGAVAGDNVYYACGQARLLDRSQRRQRGERRELGRLQHHRVAGSEGRRDLPRQHQQRKIPRNDLARRRRKRRIREIPVRATAPIQRGDKNVARPVECRCRGSRGSVCRCRWSPAPRSAANASAPSAPRRRDNAPAHDRKAIASEAAPRERPSLRHRCRLRTLCDGC